VAPLSGAMPGENVVGDLTQPLGPSPGKVSARPQAASTAAQSTAPGSAPGYLIVHLYVDRPHDVTDPLKIACRAQLPRRAQSNDTSTDQAALSEWLRGWKTCRPRTVNRGSRQPHSGSRWEASAECHSRVKAALSAAGPAARRGTTSDRADREAALACLRPAKRDYSSRDGSAPILVQGGTAE